MKRREHLPKQLLVWFVPGSILVLVVVALFSHSPRLDSGIAQMADSFGWTEWQKKQEFRGKIATIRVGMEECTAVRTLGAPDLVFDYVETKSIDIYNGYHVAIPKAVYYRALVYDFFDYRWYIFIDREGRVEEIQRAGT